MRDSERQKYDVILADPPWHFQNYGGDKPGDRVNSGRSTLRHYVTMSLDDIKALDVQSLAADNSILFLWAIWPLMPEAFDVIKAWGFEYKTIAWVWVKAKPSGFGFFTGMGYYTRANTEPCLLATRGKPGRPIDKSIQALIYSPVREHSRKPDEQYAKIAKLYPQYKNRLEMFARRRRAGWDAFGNEVDGSISIKIKT